MAWNYVTSLALNSRPYFCLSFQGTRTTRACDNRLSSFTLLFKKDNFIFKGEFQANSSGKRATGSIKDNYDDLQSFAFFIKLNIKY